MTPFWDETGWWTGEHCLPMTCSVLNPSLPYARQCKHLEFLGCQPREEGQDLWVGQDRQEGPNGLNPQPCPDRPETGREGGQGLLLPGLPPPCCWYYPQAIAQNTHTFQLHLTFIFPTTLWKPIAVAATFPPPVTLNLICNAYHAQYIYPRTDVANSLEEDMPAVRQLPEKLRGRTSLVGAAPSLPLMPSLAQPYG